MKPELKVPGNLSPLARACLEKLAEHGELVSLGGAIGLSTADVDAWWEGGGAAERASLIDEVESVLRAFGEVRRRTWGDVVSVELKLEGGSSFSFQVARRSARLSEPLAAPWPRGLRVDSLDDLAAAKMEALVARGAPRDFRDIRALCAVQLATPERLWMLWARRREAAAETADRFEAGLAIRTHLERIQRVRPLENIAVEADRNTARDLRTWFKESLLRGLV